MIFGLRRVARRNTEEHDMKTTENTKTKDDRDALFQETVFMLFALDIAAKLVIYGTAAFCLLK